MTEIVLSTLNARYAHASLGLRYLRANLGALHERSEIIEFVIGQRTEDMVERLLAAQPTVIGFGVYIWNVIETTRVVALLRLLAPDIRIVLGGPEVSYEQHDQPICAAADYVISGWGDLSFARLCAQVLAGEAPVEKYIVGEQPPLAAITMPYAEYSDQDLRERYLYVEASRGCPFKCEFCLSALDKTAWPFDVSAFLCELESVYARGARQFKFVDRTFNLKVDTSLKILDFFLERLAQNPADPPFVHFEVVPDHLPDRLKAAIARFPAGTLQFEIGIQSFDVAVQQRISRRQNNAAAIENLRWLRNHSQAHLHVDLIAGLPGETLQSFAAGFDQLVALAPHEIQFGILKRLRGAPIDRHSEAYALRFNPEPPYTILSTSELDFATLQHLGRYAKLWDLLYNAGRYPLTLPLLLAQSPFMHFSDFVRWVQAEHGQNHGIAVETMIGLLHQYLIGERSLSRDAVESALLSDYQRGGGRQATPWQPVNRPPRQARKGTPSRQARHLRAPAPVAVRES